MKKILAMAALNFRQATRDKIFSGVILFLILLFSLSVLLATLSVGEAPKVIRSMGIAGLEFSGVLLILFSFTMSFFKESETRILEVYLCHFSRRDYISGKILGYMGVCALYLLLGSIGWSIILLMHEAFTWKIFPVVYALFWKLSIVIAINQLFCIVFSSAIPALLCTMFMYYISDICGQAAMLAATMGNHFQAKALKIIHYLLPNIELLDMKAHIAYAELPPLSVFVSISFYSLFYIGFLWIVCQLIFTQEEVQ